MHNIYLKDLLKITECTLIKGNLDTPLINFSKDTRTINDKDVYIGIKGQNVDGSIYYQEALAKGSGGCILNDSVTLDKKILEKYPHVFIVLVKDTIKVLQELAKLKRSLYDIPVIAITGSVGKTSTKDIVASVLSKKYRVLKTTGNYNNEIGLPLTILSLKDENCLVLEMGMSNLGEIHNLTLIAKPTLSIITNIGTAHIGSLKSRENILKAKLEILDGMRNKILIINNDNDLLHDYYLKNKDYFSIITYGIHNSSLYQAQNIQTEPLFSTYDIEIDHQINHIKVNIPGEHFIFNSLAGLAVGRYFAIDMDLISAAISHFELTKKRMELETIGDITFINDAYNASLDSMVSALNYLGSLKNTRKIAILGDMLELGDYAEYLHREVGKSVYQNKIDILIIIGNNAKFIKDEALKLGFDLHNIYEYNNIDELVTNLLSIIKSHDTILIKASYGMHFYEIFSKLKTKYYS